MIATSTRMPTRPWTNWTGNQWTDAGRFERPRSLQELQELVRRATGEGQQVRVVGTGHAWARLIPAGTRDEQAKQIVVCLDRMPKTLKISPNGRRATVATGMTLKEVTRRLARKGFVLSSPPVYEKMSIGGLLGTASHGTGYGETETMSDHVVGFRMVKADGEILSLPAMPASARSPEQDDLLRAARCSLGALGVIFEVELDVYEDFWVREDDTLEPFDDVIDGLDDLIDSNQFVELFQVPLTPVIWKKQYNAAPRVFKPLISRAIKAVKNGAMIAFQATGYPLILRSLRWFPNLTPPWNRVVSRLVPTGTSYSGVNAAFHFQKVIPRIIATEWVVPRDEIPAMWRFFNAKIEEWRIRGKYPCNVMIEARFINRSQDWDDGEWTPSMYLSPAKFSETGYLELVTFGPPSLWFDFFREVEDGVIETFPNALPHWGKWFSRTEYIKARYGNVVAEQSERDHRAVHGRRLGSAVSEGGALPIFAPVPTPPNPIDEFERVRAKLDPHWRMSNDFVKAILTGTSAPTWP